MQQLEEYETFDDMNLPEPILRGVYSYGFEKPSAIQKKAIVPLAQGKNTIAQAQSGTGKTGTFTIGLLSRIDTKISSCQALILSPTHELANQTADVLKSIGQYTGIVCHTCIGGTSIDEDIRILRKGVHVVVGTPGRTYDMLRREDRSTGEPVLDGRNIKMIVLDEADEMLSKEGFQDIVYDILEELDRDYQIGLFSATMPPELLKLVEKFVPDPVKIIVKSEELTLEGIRQYYVQVDDERWKMDVITDLHKEISVHTCVIFCNSQKTVDFLTHALLSKQFAVVGIHGSMSSETRRDIMRQFRAGEIRIIITTDLLARGIDVQQVSIVFNYDLPRDIENYLHRIGRSGRFGRKGLAINLLTLPSKNPRDSRDSRPPRMNDVETIREIEKYYNTVIDALPMNFSSYL